MHIYELPNKKFKITVMEIFNDLKENTDKQLNKTKKTMHEQNKSIRDRNYKIRIKWKFWN